MAITDINGSANGKNNRGRFLPGNPGKPKGSSRNKLRDQIRKFIQDNWTDEFPKWFKALKPKEKIDVMLALMPYSVARLQAVSITDSEGNDIENMKATIDYTKLSPSTLKEVLEHTRTN